MDGDLSTQKDELECLCAMYSPEIDPLCSVQSNWCSDAEASSHNEPLWCAVTFSFSAPASAADSSARLVARCPLDYPSVAKPTFSLEIPNWSAGRAQELTQRLTEEFTARWAAGEPAIAQAVELAKYLLECEAQDPVSATPVLCSVDRTKATSSWSVLVFNHLLLGAAHKKEKELVQATRKAGLRGFIAYGTPGVVVALGEDALIDDLQQRARGIGKPCKELHRVEAADMPASLEIPAKGLAELEFPELQRICQEYLQMKGSILDG